MKDIVGPAPLQLQNCGTVKIIKQTEPAWAEPELQLHVDAGGLHDLVHRRHDAGRVHAQRQRQRWQDGWQRPPGRQQHGQHGDLHERAGRELHGDRRREPQRLRVRESLLHGVDRFERYAGCDRPQASEHHPDRRRFCHLHLHEQPAARRDQESTKTSTKSDDPLAGATFSITKGGTASRVVRSRRMRTARSASTTSSSPPTWSPRQVRRPDRDRRQAGRTVTVDTNATCEDATYVGEHVVHGHADRGHPGQVPRRWLRGDGARESALVHHVDRDHLDSPIRPTGMTH